ncbi:hypothetical protein OAG66_00780 [bacterium]|nr:hypothetical protein [bacterium]
MQAVGGDSNSARQLLSRDVEGGSSETPIKRTTQPQYKLQADHGLDRRGFASLGHTYFENSKEIASKGGRTWEHANDTQQHHQKT